MLKKYIFFLILILCTNFLLGMEVKEDEDEKSFELNLLQTNLDEIIKSMDLISFGDQKGALVESNFESHANGLKISPRSSFNLEADLLKLPPEILLLIIYYSIEDSVDIDVNRLNLYPEENAQGSWLTFIYGNIPAAFRGEPKRRIIPDFLNFREICESVKSLSLSCQAVRKLVPDAILQHCLNKLARLSREEKIKLALVSYEHKYLKSFGFTLTSILREIKSESLLASIRILLMFITKNLLFIDENQTLKFRLSDDESDDYQLSNDFQLVKILIDLQSPELINFDTIFHTVLLNPKARDILKYLINSENLPSNSYISSELMKHSFNGDSEYFNYAIDNQEDVLCENKVKFTPVICALIGGNSELLDIIFSRLSLDQLIIPNDLNQNIVHFCALYATPEILEYLFSKLTSLKREDLLYIINMIDTYQNSPLSLAIRSCSEDKTLLLLIKGAKIELLMNCDLRLYSEPSEMLKEMIKNKDVSKQIAQEFNNLSSNEPISSELVIKCCKNSKRAKNKKGSTLWTLLFAIAVLIGYSES